ncbi:MULTISPECIES: hypothetical protein [Acidianus]|uniref:Uncharacterized protein n=1 Tax=Candidatus Acidianus copahuensis TaxID=1160895 RepID=A0A031LLZ0_9CREN|nr:MULTISPECIES: hypothetical protein [Acidianus]EZQ03232.1 hypothetical protein CM19_10220 [Candidatus Acidianus copahuensis]NON61970.1 hypothetical protein [Acidianus sp. RZ1]
MGSLKERCGVIVNGRFYEIPNISTSDNEFEMDPVYLRKVLLLGEITAIVHTHLITCFPSNKDIEWMKAWKVPWVILTKKCIKAFTFSDFGIVEVDIDTLLSKELYNLVMKLLD